MKTGTLMVAFFLGGQELVLIAGFFIFAGFLAVSVLIRYTRRTSDKRGQFYAGDVMKACPFCGQSSPLAAKFCRECGKPFGA